MKSFTKTQALLSGALAFLIIASPNIASAQPQVAAYTCTQGQYKNNNGICVSSPTRSNSWPSGSTAKCRDGTYSFSQSRRGTCSRHGGVSTWR